MKTKKNLLASILCLLMVVFFVVGLTACDEDGKCSHQWGEWSNTTNATCTEAGTQERKCSECGEVETTTIPALGHNTEGTVTHKDATCTEAGVVGGTYCTRCNNGKTAAEATITALGHNTDGTVAHKDATCTEAGVVGGTYCTRCDNGKAAAEATITALGHKEVIDASVTATFSNPGLTEGSHCSVCGEIIIAQIEIPALGSEVESGQNIVANTEYSDNEEGVSYRYNYSLNVSDDESFVLTTLKIGTDETYSIDYSCGTIFNIGNGIHELRFYDGHDCLYIKFINGKFEFCKKDGSKWDKDKYERPEGTTSIDLIPKQGNSVYGYQDLANNLHGASMQELYRRMFYACEGFVNNTNDIQSTNGFYILDTIDLSRYVITFDEVISVWKVFIVENPRYYWLSNSLTLEGSNLIFCIDEAYSKAAYRAQCDAAIDDMLKECNILITDGMSDLEIALTVHNFIITRMDYAYENDGVTPQDDIWAHNMVGCAKYNLGVCESYAETFMFLCKNYGVDAIIVTGTAGDENHAWNMVKIGGLWYGVDVTWDETNKEKQISYNCFGMSNEYCESTHNPDDFNTMGIGYLYQLPKMSANSIELVDLFKNGEFIGTYVSIDNAFEHMTDQNADYTLQLYSYSLQGPLLISSPNIVYNINDEETPVVKSIAIKGEFMDLGEGYGTCTRVYINNSLTLFADIMTLYDISPIGNYPLYLQNNCLEIAGEFSLVYIPVIGNIDDDATSMIICNAHGNTGTGVEFWNEVTVYEMDVPQNVLFRGQSTIIHLKAKMANVYGGNLNVENLYGIYEYCNIGLEQMGSANIQNLCSDSNIINIHLQFGKLEEFPRLILGDMECNVNLTLNGEVHYSVTDLWGNEIYKYFENANPFNVTTPLANLSQSSDFEKVKIGYANQGDKTSLYMLDSNGDIILKPYKIENGLVIIDDKILHYEGSDAILNIPEGITYIESYAFHSCNSLVSVTLPESLLCIGENAFAGCPSLIEICNKSHLNITAGSRGNGHVAANAKHIITDESQSAVKLAGDYVFYDDGVSVFLIKYLGTESEIILPEYEGMKYGIAKSAFENNDCLIVVTVAQSVTCIEMNAFMGCDSLEKVFIPNSVLVVERQAFGGCEKVTIYCESDSQPSGWDSDWHFQVSYGPDDIHIYNEVIWGYNP